MKSQKIIYWTTTGLFSALMVINGFAYFASEVAKQACIHFGFPDYFRIELGVAKLLGATVLLLPMIKGRLKEWAYAGFVITLISGFIAHVASGDTFAESVFALVALAVLFTSYFTYHKLNN